MILSRLKTICLFACILLPVVVPAQTDGCVQKGGDLYRQKKLKQAIKTLEKCRDQPGASEVLGRAYFELGYMVDAREHLQKGIQKNPGDVQQRVLFAKTFSMNKEFAAGVLEFKKLTAEFPASVEAKKGLAEALGWNRQYEPAIAIYRELLSKEKTDYESWVQIGVLLSWDKKFSKAKEEYQKILAARPPKNWEVEVRLKLAEVMSWEKKMEESLKAYDNIIKKYPQEVRAYLGKGQVLEWQAKYKPAIKVYEAALKVDSKNQEAKARLQNLMWVQ